MHAVDEAVGVQGVLHGEALAEELGVPQQVHPVEVGEAVGEATGGAGGDGGFAGHQGGGAAAGGQHLGERVDGGFEVAEVRAEAVLALGRAQAQEVHLGVGELGVVGGEAQPAAGEAAGQDLLEAGLVEGRDAGLQRSDALGVDVQADHVVTELGHRGGVHRTEVSDSDHGESGGHREMLLPRGLVGSCGVGSCGNGSGARSCGTGSSAASWPAGSRVAASCCAAVRHCWRKA